MTVAVQDFVAIQQPSRHLLVENLHFVLTQWKAEHYDVDLPCLIEHVNALEKQIEEARVAWAMLTKSTCVADLRNKCKGCDEKAEKLWNVLEMNGQEVKEFPGDMEQ